MPDDDRSLTRHDGPRHEGAMRTSPYPTSRLAPVHDLVDIAAEIARADGQIASHATGKLRVIADQIRRLQEAAGEVLAKAQRDAELHRARCQFEKRPGKTYHLYRREDGVTYFSMIAPDEWSSPQPQTFVGSYRLEADMSWTPAEEIAPREDDDRAIAALLGRAK